MSHVEHESPRYNSISYQAAVLHQKLEDFRVLQPDMTIQ